MEFTGKPYEKSGSRYETKWRCQITPLRQVSIRKIEPSFDDGPRGPTAMSIRY